MKYFYQSNLVQIIFFNFYHDVEGLGIYFLFPTYVSMYISICHNKTPYTIDKNMCTPKMKNEMAAP